MRRGRIVTGVIAVMAAALLWVPASLGATPQQIYRDLADGKLDKSYSSADLNRFLKNASVQMYPGDTPATGGTLPGNNSSGNNGVLGATQASGSLPFTGLELGIFALVGAILLASGLLLRSTARQKSRS